LVKDKLLDLQSPRAVLNITNSMRIARFKDPKILQTSCFVYKMLTSFDVEEPPHVSTLYGVSDLLQVLTFYNVPRYDMYESFVKQMNLVMNNVDSLDRESHIKLKFCLTRFLRYQMLFPGIPGQKLA
jgi:hypothetical protein